MEKVWLSDSEEIAEIINIKKEWTSWPHGSGTNYEVYTIKKKDDSIVEYSTLGNDFYKTVITLSRIEGQNRILENEIKECKKSNEEKIKQNNKIIKLLK